MRTEIYECLTELRGRYGPREFGKICQKFLALAYRSGGCMHVVERGVQGVDVDAAWGQEKYSTEVKTTTTNCVAYQRKDADGLAARQRDGYRPLLAVLRLRLLSEWYLVDAKPIKPGLIEIDSLRPYRCRDLEHRLRSLFDAIVKQHFEGTLLGSQAYLDQVLREVGVQVYETAL
jgi:hypothetical protein